MATEAQINANRANAQKSTGPRTEEGKARSSRNAAIHGLCAQSPQLPGEPPDFFETLLARYNNELCPIGCLEEDLTFRMAVATQRMLRARRFEDGYLEERVRDDALNPVLRPGNDADRLAWAFHIDCLKDKTLDHLNRYTRAAQRDYDNCRDTLLKMQAGRKTAEAAEPAPALAPAPPPTPRQAPTQEEYAETNPVWPKKPYKEDTYDSETHAIPVTGPPENDSAA